MFGFVKVDLWKIIYNYHNKLLLHLQYLFELSKQCWKLNLCKSTVNTYFKLYNRHGMRFYATNEPNVLHNYIFKEICLHIVKLITVAGLMGKNMTYCNIC